MTAKMPTSGSPEKRRDCIANRLSASPIFTLTLSYVNTADSREVFRTIRLRPHQHWADVRSSRSSHPNNTPGSTKANTNWDPGRNPVRKGISTRYRSRAEIPDSRHEYKECRAVEWDNSFPARLETEMSKSR